MGLRKVRFAAWALLAWCAFLPILASAQGVDRSLRVVVNKENKLASLTTDDLTRIFLGKKPLWDSGTRLVPPMPEEESPVGVLFLSGSL